MSDPLYQLSDVRRQLSETFALCVDRLSIARGEVLSLLGPTGSGKTTLLRLLTGLESPQTGCIQFIDAGFGPSSPLALLRKVAMVHQRPILLKGSVQDNVQYCANFRNGQSGANVGELLTGLGLDRLAAQDARSLSGGQTQLVALARALACEPEVLLLDEPTANLDPTYVARVEQVIADMRRQRGLTVIWATHNLFQARRVSQRLALLLDGRIVEVGANPEFFDSPADSRTAAFVQGKMVY